MSCHFDRPKGVEKSSPLVIKQKGFLDKLEMTNKITEI